MPFKKHNFLEYKFNKNFFHKTCVFYFSMDLLQMNEIHSIRQYSQHNKNRKLLVCLSNDNNIYSYEWERIFLKIHLPQLHIPLKAFSYCIHKTTHHIYLLFIFVLVSLYVLRMKYCVPMYLEKSTQSISFYVQSRALKQNCEL